MYNTSKSRYTPISLSLVQMINGRDWYTQNFTSTQTTPLQIINVVNYKTSFCCVFYIRLNSVAKDEEISMLIKYLIP